MTADWFPQWVSALSGDAPTHQAEEIEIAFAQCTVHAAPVQDGQALGVTLRLLGQDDVDLFADLDVLRAMVRLHQGEAAQGQWRFALSDEHAPIFVTSLPAEQATPERFRALVDDALAHVQLVLQLVHIVRSPSTAGSDMALWAQRG